MTTAFAPVKKRAQWALVAIHGAAILGALMLSSCLTIPQPSSHSALAAPPSLEKSIEQSMKRGAVKAGDWPYDKWWESFGDDTLNSLVQRAIADSPDMRMAIARARLAEQMARAAGAATSFSFSVGGNAAVQRMSENSWIPAEFLKNPYTSAELSANLGYNLDLWDAARLAAEGKIDAQKAAQAQIHSARLALSLAITHSYLRLQNIRRLADIAGAAVVARQQSREMIRQKEQQGMETEINVERAKYGVTLITGSLFALRGAEAIERNRLAALMGAGPDQGLAIANPPGRIRLPAAKAPDGLTLDLAHRRPDIIAARWRVEAAASAIGASRGAFYPNINLRGLIGLQTVEIGKLLSGGSLVYNVASAIHLPIFDGGGLRARLGAAEAEYDMAVETYNSKVIHAAREAADALARIDNLDRRIAVARRALTMAEKIHNLTQVRFDKGVDDYLTVLQAQDEVYGQARDLARLEGEAAQARVALFAALGGGYHNERFKTGKMEEQ
ncbi:MAG: efflux transporter outer membrane subunit [Nitrospinota bacterium]|nr:efflux transporter outer membrane subunit [Nitrospinota bacterium]